MFCRLKSVNRNLHEAATAAVQQSDWQQTGVIDRREIDHETRTAETPVCMFGLWMCTACGVWVCEPQSAWGWSVWRWAWSHCKASRVCVQANKSHYKIALRYTNKWLDCSFWRIRCQVTLTTIMTHSFSVFVCNVPRHLRVLKYTSFAHTGSSSSPSWIHIFCIMHILSLDMQVILLGVCDREKEVIVCVIYSTGAAFGRRPEHLRDIARRTESKNTTAEWAGLKKKKQWLSPLASLPLGLQAARCCLRMKY